MSGFVANPSGSGLRLAIRFALRELRGGLRGFYIFIACIALGVAAIAGVTSVSRALTEGISAEGQSILGGDLSFSLIHRQADEAEKAYLNSLGKVSGVATMRTDRPSLASSRGTRSSATASPTPFSMHALPPTQSLRSHARPAPRLAWL